MATGGKMADCLRVVWRMDKMALWRRGGKMIAGEGGTTPFTFTIYPLSIYMHDAIYKNGNGSLVG